MFRHTIPFAPQGLRVGLLGGSFDPAHRGHLHLSHQGMMRFGLDQMWWLVTPGNPLKDDGPKPLARRMHQAQKVAGHPRIFVSDVEAQLGTRYTIDTLNALGRLYPKVDFTWIMGADNLAQFHLWKDWQDIFNMIPIGVLARPGSRMAARRSVAARRFEQAQVSAGALSTARAPAWGFVNMPMSPESSTRIRNSGGWD